MIALKITKKEILLIKKEISLIDIILNLGHFPIVKIKNLNILYFLTKVVVSLLNELFESARDEVISCTRLDINVTPF